MNEQQQEARLPQIDPVTFAALNVIDGFLARAPLTRQEHTEANRSMQHLVQTIELLQGMVRTRSGGPGSNGGLGAFTNNHRGTESPEGKGSLSIEHIANNIH